MKKKILKKAILAVAVILLAISLYNLVDFFRSGKQSMEISINSKYFTNSNLDAIVRLKDEKTDMFKAGKIKVELLDHEGKKVKGTKQKYNVQEDEDTVISIPLNEKIETGNYSLKVIATDGLLKDEKEIDVAVVNEKKTNVVISLDKGIYKPGDTVNFRAMLLSKKDDTPISEDVCVSIYDGNENRVFIKETKSSEFGIVSGSFELADEVNSGEYKIVVSTNAVEQTKIFNVNSYVIPTFEATITTDKENYLVGETAQVSLNTKYFFGEPVKNANITGKINETEIVGLTDENGMFQTTYTVEKAGSVNINLQVVDTSNYLVEAQKTILGSTDIFEIEILPENQELIRGIDNDVYIFTKYADGTPLKTHTTIKIGEKSRQVITDKNGVGKITLTADDIDSLKYKTVITVKSEDMNGNIVSKEQKIAVSENNGIIIHTDKVKYSQGDDVHITLISTTDIQNEKIFVYKDDELLKMLSTDQKDIEFNLEDCYGLIDIYVGKEKELDYYSRKYYGSTYLKYSKKTIFVKPNKDLNIGIKTDQEEYKPGEDLTIQFTTTDSAKENVDAALLVSILDEAILNLADNDLSIDNIKLALEDLDLVDGITAADIYANIIDDKDEQTLMGLLLKQNSKNYNVRTYYMRDTSGLSQEYIKGFIPGMIGFIIFFIYASICSEKFRKLLIHGINIVVMFCIINAWLYDIFSLSYDMIPIVSFAITFVIYVLYLYKKKEFIFEMILEIIMIPIVLLVVFGLCTDIMYYNDFAFLIFLLPPVLWTILVAFSRKFTLKRPFVFIKKILERISKVEIIYLIAYIIINLINIYSSISIIIKAFILNITYYKFVGKKGIIKEKNKIDSAQILGYASILACFILIGTIIGIMQINSNFAGNIEIDNSNRYDPTISEDALDLTQFEGKADTSGATQNSYSDWLDASQNFITKGEDSSDRVVIGDENKTIEDEIEKEQNVEEHIRNVFLESLAFIPELITNEGTAETTIKISDNITTWNIQTVGNTKQGNIGFATSNFRVFQEFFIDFTLPTNSVVTDKVSIPVTIYNYKDTNLVIQLEVKENDWSKIGEYTKQITIKPQSTEMIYVPIEIVTAGKQILRIEAKAEGDIQDIVEKSLEITPNGLQKTNVVSSGTTETSFSQDFFTTEEAIEGTRTLKVKIYPSMMSQVIEGMESILKMPTGCFEQTSSSLYPNILVLKYLEENQLANEQIKAKALNYISKGYQKLLSYEVSGEKGGYSLYGDSPAETVITAFGLMEFSELSEVYEVDENVIENMIEFLFKKQNSNGSFDYKSTYIGGAQSTDELAMNAYIIWALSEVCPEDSRLEKSITYLEKKLTKVEDNYTRALIANVFSNVDHESTREVIKDLMQEVKVDGNKAYISSNVKDYYGTSRKYQTIQTTALTSLVLIKENSNIKTNQSFIDYIIEMKDARGTWNTTQSTILALKAINKYNEKTDMSNQTISIKVNNEIQEIEIGENALDFYEVEFENIQEECKIAIDMKKGKLCYEVIEEYYVPYEKVEVKEMIKVKQEIVSQAKVNDVVTQKIQITNLSENLIRNGLIQINVPQGCSTIEESLMQLKYKGIIEKYEYSYGKINLYIRNFDENEIKNIEVQYRAQYPENITGASVRVYDYYNPDIEGLLLPVNITITQ